MPIKTTEPRKLSNGDLLVVKYGFDEEFAYRTNQTPYFSITTETYSTHRQRGEVPIKFEGKSYWMTACGAGHYDIPEAFPELEPLIRYHLVSTAAPMHYYANALYWLEMFYGVSKWSTPHNVVPLEAFKATVLFNESCETIPSLDDLKQWCDNRLSSIMDHFQHDCKMADVAWPENQ